MVHGTIVLLCIISSMNEQERVSISRVDCLTLISRMTLFSILGALVVFFSVFFFLFLLQIFKEHTIGKRFRP